jgi:nicotinamidase-related amidase
MNKEKTALLIIDMQEDFLAGFITKDYHKLTDNISKSISLFKENLYPIINVTFKDCGELDGCVHWFDESLEKDNPDAFVRTSLDDILKKRNIKTIVPAGVQSYACVKDTVFSARKYGYNVLVCSQLIGGVDDLAHENHIPMYNKLFENIKLKNLHKIF